MATYLWGAKLKDETRYILGKDDDGSNRVQAYFVRPKPEIFDSPVVLIDTPGFDDGGDKYEASSQIVSSFLKTTSL